MSLMILWFSIIAFLSHIIPYRLAVFITRRIADFMYFTFYRRRREIVFNNFRIIKNRELTHRELFKYVMVTYENFATFIYEFLILPAVYKKGILKYLTPINVDRMRRPSLVLTAHLGNWEWGASMLDELGYNPTVIALEHSRKMVTTFFTRRRNLAGMKVTYVGKSLKDVLTALKNGDVVATLGDRDYTGSFIPVNFMGKKIGLPKGVFQLSQRLNVPIIPAFCVKESKRYNVYFEEPLYPDNGYKVAEKWANILERYVKKYATQWYIFDNIWID